MAFLLGCENVHLEYPTKVIFESLSLGIDDGDAIGVVGKNGDGKSSLLRLFDGTIEPDEGRVLRTRGVRVATLAQKDALDDNATVLASILGDTPEYVWASDARVREILDNLVGDLDPNVRIGALSGGQRRRVDLARVLIADVDIVLLDEPTNHLDIEGIHWLAEHLRQRFSKKQGALVVVTHDRWFLDEVCTSMLKASRVAIRRTCSSALSVIGSSSRPNASDVIWRVVSSPGFRVERGRVRPNRSFMSKPRASLSRRSLLFVTALN